MNIKLFFGFVFTVGMFFSVKVLSAQKMFTSLEKALKKPDEVEILNLSDQKLTEIPFQIGKLKNLKYLILDRNNLTGLPESVFGLTELEELTVYDNQLTDLSGNIFRLKKLRSLDVGHNRLTALPKELAALPELEKLNVSENPIEKFPESLGTALTKIKFLGAAGCGLTAFSDKWVTQVETLFVDRNRISRLNLSPFSKLTRLGADGNPLTEIRLPVTVEYLFLTDCGLESVPGDVYRCKNLKRLVLRQNKITTVGDSTGGLSRLEQADFAFNRLTFIPESFWQLPGLKYVCLRGNVFSEEEKKKIMIHDSRINFDCE